MSLYQQQLDKIERTNEFQERQKTLSSGTDVITTLLQKSSSQFANQSKYFVKGQQVPYEQTSINLSKFLIERGYDVNNPQNIPLEAIKYPEKKLAEREAISIREILLGAGVKGTSLDVTNQSSIDNFNNQVSKIVNSGNAVNSYETLVNDPNYNMIIDYSQKVNPIPQNVSNDFKTVTVPYYVNSNLDQKMEDGLFEKYKIPIIGGAGIFIILIIVMMMRRKK